MYTIADCHAFTITENTLSRYFVNLLLMELWKAVPGIPLSLGGQKALPDYRLGVAVGCLPRQRRLNTQPVHVYHEYPGEVRSH